MCYFSTRIYSLRPGHTDAVEHEIDTGHSTPIRCTSRRKSPQMIKKEEECVTDMLVSGQIEPSDIPWSAPVILVTKKDSGSRFCVDYRRLNIFTVKDAYPLHRIDDTLDMLAGKQWFSTLDLGNTLGIISIQSYAVWTLQCTGHVWETHGQSPAGTAMFTLFSVPRWYHLIWHYLPWCPGQYNPDILKT